MCVATCLAVNDHDEKCEYDKMTGKGQAFIKKLLYYADQNFGMNMNNLIYSEASFGRK